MKGKEFTISLCERATKEREKRGFAVSNGELLLEREPNEAGFLRTRFSQERASQPVFLDVTDAILT